MPILGGQPSAMITQPAASATNTVAIRPHISDARRDFAITHARSVGTATVSSVINHITHPSRHQGRLVAATGTAAAAWANRRLIGGRFMKL